MKLRVEVDDESYTLELRRNGTSAEYAIGGAISASGSASVKEISPGVYSILLDGRSHTIHVSQDANALEVWAGTRRHFISLSDPRDSVGENKRQAASGPVEIRAPMPGKIVKLMAAEGAKVRAGQPVIVVEAMKMQNEMKSPKDGVVSRVLAPEGATVSAGETLIVVE